MYVSEVDLDPNRTFCPEAGCETVCHVCCTSSEEYHTKPTPVECPTVSGYQRQGGVGWGGTSYNL